MTNLEKAKEICKRHYFDSNLYDGCMEMAEWKDDMVNGFLFELSILLTEPKTDIERAICFAFPMSGLNAIDEVGDFLREKLWEYEHKGTILKNE